MTNFGQLPSSESELVGTVEGATPIPRTKDELLERFKSEGDMFGFGKEVLLPYFDFDDIKGELKSEYVAKVEAGDATWTQYPATVELVLACAEDYMRFAWGKAMDHRGISAGRSLYKIATWLWMAGDDKAVEALLDDANYAPYGVPALRIVCEMYEWPMPPADTSTAGGGVVSKMMTGDPCTPACVSCRS